VPDFEFAVLTAATIGEHLLQTRKWFKTNLDFCTSLFGYFVYSLQLLQLRKACLQIFVAHANSTDFSHVSWAKLGLSRYLDHTFGLDFYSVKSLHFLA